MSLRDMIKSIKDTRPRFQNSLSPNTHQSPCANCLWLSIHSESLVDLWSCWHRHQNHHQIHISPSHLPIVLLDNFTRFTPSLTHDSPLTLVYHRHFPNPSSIRFP